MYDTEAAFINPNMDVDMFIKWPEVIKDLVIITKEFLEEYCILLEESMYGNVDTALLWLKLLSKYLIKDCNLKRSKSDSYIFYKKDYGGNLELVITVNVDDLFMARNPELLKNIK